MIKLIFKLGLLTAAVFCFTGNANAQKDLYGKWTVFCPTEKTADNSVTICSFCPTELSPDNRSLTIKNLKVKITRKEIVILDSQNPVSIPYEWQSNSNTLVFSHQNTNYSMQLMYNTGSKTRILKSNACSLLLVK